MKLGDYVVTRRPVPQHHALKLAPGTRGEIVTENIDGWYRMVTLHPTKGIELEVCPDDVIVLVKGESL